MIDVDFLLLPSLQLFIRQVCCLSRSLLVKHEPLRNQSNKAYKWNRNRLHKSRPVSRHTVRSVHVVTPRVINCQETVPVCRVEENEDNLIRDSNVLATFKKGDYVSQSEILSNARFWDYPESHVAFTSLIADQTVLVSLLPSAEENVVRFHVSCQHHSTQLFIGRQKCQPLDISQHDSFLCTE